MTAARKKVPTTEDCSDHHSSSTCNHGPDGIVDGDDDTDHDIMMKHDHNDLSLIQAVTLLTADCLGVGILALPKDVNELGWIVGLGFLILNLPINYYSGKILAQTATQVEHGSMNGDDDSSNNDNHNKNAGTTRIRKDSNDFEMVATSEQIEQVIRRDAEEAVKDGILRERNTSGSSSSSPPPHMENARSATITKVTVIANDDNADNDHHHHDEGFQHQLHAETISTHDFIGLTHAVFTTESNNMFSWTRIVMALYFTNIFLVLGDYILVMSYAVAAMLGDTICLPWAGVIASILMFALCQLRTMAKLGREASIISLACLFIVLIQCLIASSEHAEPPKTARTSVIGDSLLFRKFSALASIGFAMGSQKLFLNIRHEMRHKEEAPRTLLYSLSTYGIAYILVCVTAGTDPPSFLFEAIPEGISRRTAGLLLWIHVAVSYAINSQAICASLDRRLTFLSGKPYQKWMVLTGSIALSSYTVANAIPFFQDLVSLIGALTTVPLTLSMPALLFRHCIQQVSLWRPTLGSVSSYSLLVYSGAFLVIGLAGSLYSIDRDWANQGKPFSCT